MVDKCNIKLFLHNSVCSVNPSNEYVLQVARLYYLLTIYLQDNVSFVEESDPSPLSADSSSSESATEDINQGLTESDGCTRDEGIHQKAMVRVLGKYAELKNIAIHVYQLH